MIVLHCLAVQYRHDFHNQEITMEADKILNEWQKFLNNGDLKNIVRLYSDEAVLWGTFSNIIRDCPRLIEEYFNKLFEKNCLKVDLGIVRSREYNGIHLYSGTYEFSYIDSNFVTLPARFTFVVGRDKEAGFRIMEHHSSLIPVAP